MSRLDAAEGAAGRDASELGDENELETPMPFATPLGGNGFTNGDTKGDGENTQGGIVVLNEERPPLETFVTAQEDLPRAN
ncbi:hypothetical protein O1611_g10592 [Lasiodiplodia mahajangana]|uniref:Uncharacterized protein n=1 Tax=Lasiodiplodia mahajangana TaxID=1108764 RepID=A0ACC2IWH4_9PEZI|nr:hypothetical protein O1611_g10592 [Lasiodiplodia mahajangana]